MARMDQLFNLTNQLLEVLKSTRGKDNDRADILEEVNNLLVEREALLRQIKPPYTEEEEKIGLNIIKLDKTIKERMENLYREIQQDLKQIKQKRDTNITYINPYKNMKTVDGMYCDNKL